MPCSLHTWLQCVDSCGRFSESVTVALARTHRGRCHRPGHHQPRCECPSHGPVPALGSIGRATTANPENLANPSARREL